MPKLHSVLALVLLFLAHHSSKGQEYQVSLGDAPYQTLSTYTQLNQNPWPRWHSYNNVPIGFGFQYFDREFESFQLEVSSRLVFDESHFYFFDPLALVHVQDAGTGGVDAKSLIAYHTEGKEGEQVFTIEYRDVRLARDTSKFINFQVRLYEKDRSLELHMGPHSAIKADSDLQLGPYSGVYQLNSISPIDFKDALNLRGSPIDPERKYFTGQGVPYLTYTLNGLPAEGQVIKYLPATANGIEQKGYKPTLHWDVKDSRVYNNSIHSREVAVYDLLGQCCFKGMLAPQASLTMNMLPKGSYLLVSEHQSLKIIL